MSRPAGLSRFVGSLSLVVVLNLLVKPGWVLIENVVQDRLGHAAYGLYTAFWALTMVLAAVFDLGLTNYSVRRGAAEPDFLSQYFPTILPLRLLAAAAGLLAMLGLGYGLGYHGHQLALLAGVGVGLLLSQYAQFLRGPLQARQHFNTDAVLSVLEKGLLAGLVLAALPWGLSLEGYIGLRLGAAAFIAILFYGLLVRFFGWLPYRWQGARARRVLGASLPFAALTILYGVNERVDMVMLERLASPREAGYYAGAYRWADAAMMYLWTVLPLFYARFAHLTARPAEQRELLWLGQRLAAAPLLFVVAFALFRGELAFWQFGHSSTAEVARMTHCLQILALSVLVHGFFALYSTLLTSTGHERAVSGIVGVSIGLNISLNLLLLPRFGAVAGAWNTLLCAVVVSGGYLAWTAARTSVPVPWRLLARLLLAFGLLCGAWYVVQQGIYLSWYVETGLMAVLFGLILLGTGLVRQQEIWQVLRLKR